MKGISKLAIGIALTSHGLRAVAAVEEPAHIDWGVVEVTPLAVLNIGYDDNIFQNSVTDGLKNKSSTVYDLEASVEFKAQQGLNTYVVRAAAKNKHFTSEQDADFTNIGLDANLNHELNRRNRIDLTLGIGNYHDEGSTVNGVVDLSAPEYIRTTGRLLYSLGGQEAILRADLFGGYNMQDYKTSNGLVQGNDRKTTELGGTAFYRFMPVTDALVEIKQRKLDYTGVNSAGYDITSYLVGLSWEATVKTTGYAKLGRRYRSSQVSGVGSEGYTGWEVGASYLPLEHSLIQFSTARDYGLESGNPQDVTFTQGTSTEVSWKHGWTSRISTRVTYRYTNEELQRASGEALKHLTLNDFGVGVEWQLRRYATLGFSWNTIDRNEKALAVGQTPDGFSRNVYMLTAEVSL
ncbi:hypothetical protein [Endozoicomonas sp. ALB115]|uniref:hypothetical protein n=1 Tax=Endozoicomonas sp. ALB115 TaxID=3403074 RepID=UPI003BB64D52